MTTTSTITNVISSVQLRNILKLCSEDNPGVSGFTYFYSNTQSETVTDKKSLNSLEAAQENANTSFEDQSIHKLQASKQMTETYADSAENSDIQTMVITHGLISFTKKPDGSISGYSGSFCARHSGEYKFYVHSNMIVQGEINRMKSTGHSGYQGLDHYLVFGPFNLEANQCIPVFLQATSGMPSFTRPSTFKFFYYTSYDDKYHPVKASDGITCDVSEQLYFCDQAPIYLGNVDLPNPNTGYSFARKGIQNISKETSNLKEIGIPLSPTGINFVRKGIQNISKETLDNHGKLSGVMAGGSSGGSIIHPNQKCIPVLNPGIKCYNGGFPMYRKINNTEFPYEKHCICRPGFMSNPFCEGPLDNYGPEFGNNDDERYLDTRVYSHEGNYRYTLQTFLEIDDENSTASSISGIPIPSVMSSNDLSNYNPPYFDQFVRKNLVYEPDNYVWIKPDSVYSQMVQVGKLYITQPSIIEFQLTSNPPATFIITNNTYLSEDMPPGCRPTLSGLDIYKDKVLSTLTMGQLSNVITCDPTAPHKVASIPPTKFERGEYYVLLMYNYGCAINSHKLSLRWKNYVYHPDAEAPWEPIPSRYFAHLPYPPSEYQDITYRCPSFGGDFN